MNCNINIGSLNINMLWFVFENMHIDTQSNYKFFAVDDGIKEPNMLNYYFVSRWTVYSNLFVETQLLGNMNNDLLLEPQTIRHYFIWYMAGYKIT